MASIFGWSLGGDEIYRWLLTKPDAAASLATGFRVQLGDGTATPLYLHTDGIGTYSSGGYVHKFVSDATAARTVTFADSDGLIIPVKRSVLGADFTNSTTSQNAVTGFTVTLAANGVYHFEMILLVQSAATGTGVRIAVTGPAEIDFVTYDVAFNSSSSLGTGSRISQVLSAFGTTVSAGDSPFANTTFPILVKGIIKTNGSGPTSPIGLTVGSETNASQVTVKAGSEIIVSKRN